MSGPPLAWVAAVEAVAKLVGFKPLPAGINVVETDDWKLALNSGKEPATHEGTELPPFGVLASHKQFFVFGMLDPAGGVFTGMSEDNFIEHMKAIAA